jgi:hypothetical protein
MSKGWWFRVVRRWSDVAFIALSALLFYWVVLDAFTSRIVTLSQGADYWEHTAALRALEASLWHPKNPHLVSPAASPRFIPSFVFAAAVANALKLDALGAMGVSVVCNTLLLLSGIFFFFRTYFRDPRASLYGLVIMFGSWYDAWHYSNVYQLKIFFSVAGYPSTAALGMCLLGFAWTLEFLRGRSRVWPIAPLLSVWWGLVLVTHPLTAVLGFVGAGLLALTEARVPRRLRALVLGTLAVGVLLALLWPYFSVLRVLSGGGGPAVDSAIRRLAGSASEVSGRLHPFYRLPGFLKSLGLALGGIPIALYLILRRRHWFISLGALAMAVPFVANAFVDVPLGHRFILLAIFFLQVALVWGLLKLTWGAPEALRILARVPLRWGGRVLVTCVLVACAWVNLGAALERWNLALRQLNGRESVNVRYGREAAEIAGPRAIILAAPHNAWPIPSFGPKVTALLHENPLVFDAAEREGEVTRFLMPDAQPSERLAILRRYGVTHVLLHHREAARLGASLAGIASRRLLSGGFALYTLDLASVR